MLISWAHFILLVSDRAGAEPGKELQNLNKYFLPECLSSGTKSLVKEKLFAVSLI